MAFDRNNSTQLTALISELQTDPIGMGYVLGGSTSQTEKMLDDPVNNVGGETVETSLDAAVLVEVIDPQEYTGNQVEQGERDYIKLMFDANIFRGVDIEQYRAKIKSVFPANGATNTAINALQRVRSRAEVLFGNGTDITKQDLLATGLF